LSGKQDKKVRKMVKDQIRFTYFDFLKMGADLKWHERFRMAWCFYWQISPYKKVSKTKKARLERVNA